MYGIYQRHSQAGVASQISYGCPLSAAEAFRTKQKKKYSRPYVCDLLRYIASRLK